VAFPGVEHSPRIGALCRQAAASQAELAEKQLPDTGLQQLLQLIESDRQVSLQVPQLSISARQL